MGCGDADGGVDGGDTCWKRGLSVEVDATDTYRLPAIPDESSVARFARGVGVGDPAFDALQGWQLRAAAASVTSKKFQRPCGKEAQRARGWDGCDAHPAAAAHAVADCRSRTLGVGLPAWADPERMRRGQAVFKEHCLYFMRSFEVALMWGCRIDRFADVLVRSGYTSSPLVAFQRFRDTARHVVIWCSDPAFAACGGGGASADCDALNSIVQVRAAHALARRHVAATGGCTVGVPVSQFDMAFTLMAFSILALDGVTNDCCQPLSRQEVDDYLHLWRVIGSLHGILDEFNPCNDPADAAEILKDIFELFFFAGYASGGKSAARKLTLTVFDGFSMYGIGTGRDLLGATFLRAMDSKPFIPLSCIAWMPVGRALMGGAGQETAHRRLRLARHVYSSLLDLLKRRPGLQRSVHWGYYHILQWTLIKEGVSPKRFESVLRILSVVNQALVASLARLCGLFGLLPDEGPLPLREAPEEERRALFDEWRSSFDGFTCRRTRGGGTSTGTAPRRGPGNAAGAGAAASASAAGGRGDAPRRWRALLAAALVASLSAWLLRRRRLRLRLPPPRGGPLPRALAIAVAGGLASSAPAL